VFQPYHPVLRRHRCRWVSIMSVPLSCRVPDDVSSTGERF
jgi:hypothetical protein